MKKSVVNCVSYKNNVFTEKEISVDAKFYPCCMMHYHHHLYNTFYDDYLDNLPKNWNSLEHNSMDKINQIYKDYIDPLKWESIDTCPPCCFYGCAIK